MKSLFKFWLTLVLFLIIGFLIWFPTESQIKSCMVTSMFEVDLCPSSKDYVPISKISKNIQNAIIFTEDASFYRHRGFDTEGIQHCYKKLKEKKRIVCGGSTITQQLAKNMFLSKNKNFLRKGIEALITIKLEDTLTKKEILEKYLNIVQFGKDVYGIKKATQYYFKKTPSEISPEEAAFLAMVLPNPDKYSQSFYKKDLTKFARKRITKIVSSLRKFGRINEASYENSLGNIDYFFKSRPVVAKPKEPEEETTVRPDDNEINIIPTPEELDELHDIDEDETGE